MVTTAFPAVSATTLMSAAAATACSSKSTRPIKMRGITEFPPAKKTVKPVAIFRHAASEGPGYFATYLDRHSVPWRVGKVDTGEAIPENPSEYSGLAFMGGPMSVNDSLPWIAPTLDLIRAAAPAGGPLLRR